MQLNNIHTRIFYLLLLLVCAATAGKLQAQTSFNGLNFDGVNDYINCGTTLGNFGTSDFTVEIWFKTTNTAGTLPLFSKRSTCNHANFWNINMGGGKITFEVDQDGSGTNYGGFTTTATYNNGAWHHLACTRSGTALRTYIDGALAASGTSAGVTNLNNTTTMEIGALPCPYYFNGTLDDARFWNRALCQAEVQNTMNGELPNPTTQTGLLAYYKLDQGTAAGSNTAITTATDASASGITGTLSGFALSGATSNWVAGATAITGNTPLYSLTPPGTITKSVTQTLSGATSFIGCTSLAMLTPAGASPVNGSITAKVTYDASVQSYNTHAYVQHHYDITPAANAATATGTITLYYSQADFTAYNAANGAEPDLPTTASNSDPNIGNLRVNQYHGTGTTPGTYTGTSVAINPTSVVYQNNRWEVTFPVTGFSGFFVSGNLGSPLPISLQSFTAAADARSNRLNWDIATETSGTSFAVTRSSNGIAFETIATITGTDAGDYAYNDAHPLTGVNYYRLGITAPGTDLVYSNVAIVHNSNNDGSIAVAPVPANKSITVTNTDASLNGAIATVTDMQGREIYRFTIGATTTIDISSWPAGIYSMRLPAGNMIRLAKE